MYRQAHMLVAALLALGALAACDVDPDQPGPPGSPTSIAMKQDGGVYVVPVSVNGTVTLDCVVDSGASDVNIPADVFRKLVRAGTVTKADFLGTQEYTLADGSTEPSRIFRIRSLKVGNIVVENVTASIGGVGSTALLGQSFLGRFKSWSLDNDHHALILLQQGGAARPQSAPVPEPKPEEDGTPATADAGDDAPADGSTVSQAPPGRHPHDDNTPAHGPSREEPGDDHLTAQHSESE